MADNLLQSIYYTHVVQISTQRRHYYQLHRLTNDRLHNNTSARHRKINKFLQLMETWKLWYDTHTNNVTRETLGSPWNQ